MGDGYVQVTATLRACRPKAVLLAIGEDVPRGAWVPRSCIHGADDRSLDRVAPGSAITIQVREWIAEREGLI